MNIDNEVLEIIYTKKIDVINKNTNQIELYEKEMIKLFSYNPKGLIEDEFILNLIDRAYKRVNTKEDDRGIVNAVKTWCNENNVQL